MAKFFSKCELCKKRAFYLAKRTYYHKIAKNAKGQKEICGTCHRNNKKLFSQMNAQLP